MHRDLREKKQLIAAAARFFIQALKPGTVARKGSSDVGQNLQSRACVAFRVAFRTP
jgi:hypothetical protein